MDLLVAGLGNPGTRYADTRHNLGYLVAAELAARWHAPPEREKFGGALSEVRLEDGTTVALLRPLGFMNLSGGPVQKAVRSYGLGADQSDHVHRRDVCERRYYDFVAGADAERGQHDVQRGGSVADADRPGHADEVCECLLKPPDKLATRRDPAAVEGFEQVAAFAVPK